MSTHQLPSAEICDRARASRDARFDGLFFTAVRSTGIYCRPVCPAPTPKRANVHYFANAAAASAAGYRPCLRCRPELSPEARGADRDAVVERALALIGSGEFADSSIERVAAALDLSTRHLRRVIVEATGATPMAVHATRRLLLAKQLLTETSMPITEVALASGFNSLRRFNAAFLEGNGRPPSAIRRLRAEAPGAGMQLRLAYRPALAFAEMLRFLAARAVPGVEHVDALSYRRVFGPPDAPTSICVTASSTRAELELSISPTDPRNIPAIVARVRRMFDLDADLRAVHTALAEDSLLAEVIARTPGLRMPGGWSGFETMIRAVLGQQVTVAGAGTLTRRLVERFGATRLVMPPGSEALALNRPALNRIFPTPEQIADAPLESIGLPRARAATLRALAAAVHEGRLDFRAGQRLDAFVARCTALPGIGAWTAHYVAMRALGHPDAFPAGDLVLRRVIGGTRVLSEREAEARSQSWRPWRAYAVMHLWALAAHNKVSDTKEKT